VSSNKTCAIRIFANGFPAAPVAIHYSLFTIYAL